MLSDETWKTIGDVRIRRKKKASRQAPVEVRPAALDEGLESPAQPDEKKPAIE